MKYGNIAFDEKAYGTPNPAWTKKKKISLNALANHICTRTPSNSYSSFDEVEHAIIERTFLQFSGWAGGYRVVARMVAERLDYRDGSSLIEMHETGASTDPTI